jgi:stage II sporulation protein D (peptidoglycan lytic transglycosylase)
VRRRAALLLFVALGACLAEVNERRAPVTSKPDTGWVDVELAAGEWPAVSCSGAVTVLDGTGRTVTQLASLPAGDGPRVTATAVTLAGAGLGAPPLVLHPAGHSRLAVGGVTYRGDLRLEWSSSRSVPRLVDRVQLEDYLLSVVSSEMPDQFGLEALKAQAVAARSYALSEMAKLGFLYGDTRSQAYGGTPRETALAARAVRETSGEVLLHAGRIVRAWYHSTCGGRTLPAREMFADAQLGVLDRPVDCPDCAGSPFYNWVRTWDGADVCAAVGLPVAGLQSASAPADGWPTRPAALAVTAGGKVGSEEIETLRERLSDGRPIAKQMLSTLLARAPEVVDGKLVLHGHGYGHGVGLCQYGARGFAARGASYAAILERYYPGATLASQP